MGKLCRDEMRELSYGYPAYPQTIAPLLRHYEGFHAATRKLSSCLHAFGSGGSQACLRTPRQESQESTGTGETSKVLARSVWDHRFRTRSSHLKTSAQLHTIRSYIIIDKIWEGCGSQG